MKKYIFIFFIQLSLSAGNHIRAQYSDYYYHIVGDTIEWQANNGYYSWWEFQPFFEQNLVMQIYTGPSNVGLFDSTIQLMKFFTPIPLKIIGIAGTGIRGRNIAIPGVPDQVFAGYVPDTNMFQEYYYIYDADSSRMTLKVQLPWRPLDPDPGRTLHLKIHRSWQIDGLNESLLDSCCAYRPEEYYMPIHEYYFDSAFYVTDSFYVGGSYFGNAYSLFTGIPSSDSIKTHYFYVNAIQRGFIPCNIDFQDTSEANRCDLPVIHYKWKRGRPYLDEVSPRTPFDSMPWQDVDVRYPMLIYPIVEMDTTVPPVDACPPVANVQTFVSGTTATITWDDFPNYSSVELCYGLCSSPQSQWETVEVVDNAHYTLTDLNESSCYRVMLRAFCDTSKIETPWSDVVLFYSGRDTTDTTGIQSTALSQLTFMAPNPAKDMVTVSSRYNLQEIDIWTVDGVWVHHQFVAGHKVTVPIDFLYPGTYIVAIRTYNGTTHKKLLVK